VTRQKTRLQGGKRIENVSRIMRGEIIGNNFELYPTKEEQRT
jgi:hypothetical protein